MTAILRPHQERLLAQLDQTIADGCHRVVVQAPTGFGKTIVGAHRLRLLQDAGKRALFIVPALSLIDQTIEKLYAEESTCATLRVHQAMHLMTNLPPPSRLRR